MQKKIGFLSFGHWGPVRGSKTPTAKDALLQSIDLAQASESLGLDGAYFRVHHFARQAASPIPVLSAIAATTKKIEIGTGVIDMRYENPLYLAEEAAATDLISAGRLQLGISRGSPEPALAGPAEFGYVPNDGESYAELAHRHTARFLEAILGNGIAEASPDYTGGVTGQMLPILPHSPGLDERIWWGSGSRATAVKTAQMGLNLMSSTLLTEDTGKPFHELQNEQINQYRQAWKESGWSREPRVSVSRSIIPIVSDLDRQYFGSGSHESSDQVGIIDGLVSRFGKSYIGDPEKIAAELAQDTAVQNADTLLITVPNQLGVEYNANMIEVILAEIAPAIGWQKKW